MWRIDVPARQIFKFDWESLNRDQENGGKDLSYRLLSLPRSSYVSPGTLVESLGVLLLQHRPPSNLTIKLVDTTLLHRDDDDNDDDNYSATKVCRSMVFGQ